MNNLRAYKTRKTTKFASTNSWEHGTAMSPRGLDSWYDKVGLELFFLNSLSS